MSESAYCGFGGLGEPDDLLSEGGGAEVSGGFAGLLLPEPVEPEPPEPEPPEPDPPAPELTEPLPEPEPSLDFGVVDLSL